MLLERQVRRFILNLHTKHCYDIGNRLLCFGCTDDSKQGIKCRKIFHLETPYYHCADVLNRLDYLGDKERDYDFLSSIEIFSLFMSDVFLMQNWEHLLHCIDHLNLQPSSTNHTDFSRLLFSPNFLC